jgi:hypothetical protein
MSTKGLSNGYVAGSSILYLNGSFYENVDGMLLPITEQTAQAILATMNAFAGKQQIDYSAKEIAI